MIVSDGLYLQLVLNMTIIRIQLVNIETNFMNQLDQLGMRISHIDSAFDQWIKQQNTNYNTFAVSTLWLPKAAALKNT